VGITGLRMVTVQDTGPRRNCFVQGPVPLVVPRLDLPVGLDTNTQKQRNLTLFLWQDSLRDHTVEREVGHILNAKS